MIYLTQEGKEKLEAKIAELEKQKNDTFHKYGNNPYGNDVIVGQINTYKEILSTAVILPQDKSWEDVELYPPDNESQYRKTLKYKNGVIINPNL